ncbi:GIM5 [Candida theae]|uniref:GIM5 n=1 Tax=Candida theae TaxID=1198502 RepID=A0AAD5BD41_9ASCO|nr:GIM5 [Candida theae]KAI5954762.1 GIM5 [Candida theae]
MSQPQKVDLNSLPPQQLVEIRKNIEQEINHFTQSLQALQTAQLKLKDCITSINNLEKSKTDDMLVPLSSSLYIPGKAVTKQEYLVDIGTGYYVEKKAENAKTVYDKKIKKLDEDGKKLRDILVQKNELLNGINLILRRKVIEMEKQQETKA